MTPKNVRINLLHLPTAGLRLSKNIYRRIERRFLPQMTEKVFFLHLPKCGGSSINNAIKKHYQPSEINHLDNASCVNTAKILDRDLDDFRRDLLLYYLGRQNYRYLGGHFAFSKKAYHEFGKQWHFITILRHPVDRWFSHYFYNRFKTTDELFRISEDLSTFVHSERALILGRQYVENLTEGPDRPNQHDTASDIPATAAIKALGGFSLIGCLEHLDVMQRDFEKLFGIKLNVPQSNVNPLSKDQQRDKISDEIRNRVEEICKPDLQVYPYALKRIGII